MISVLNISAWIEPSQYERAGHMLLYWGIAAIVAFCITVVLSIMKRWEYKTFAKTMIVIEVVVIYVCLRVILDLPLWLTIPLMVLGLLAGLGWLRFFGIAFEKARDKRRDSQLEKLSKRH